MAFLTKSELLNRACSMHKNMEKDEKIPNDDNKILVVLQDERYSFDTDDIKQASIDLCISNKALRYKKNSVYKIDLKEFITSDDKDAFINNLFDEEEIDAEKGLKLMPNETIFTTSRDYIVVPTDLVAFVFARSWVARLGLMVTFSAPYLPPGVQWNFPLQIKNCTENPIIIFPLKLIQIMFSNVRGYTKGYQGHYQGSTDSKPIVDRDEAYTLKDFLDPDNK